MKKMLGIVLALAVFGGAGAYYYLQHQGEPSGQHARYLPKDTLGSVNLTHINTITDQFPATAGGRLVNKETMHAILQEVQAGDQAVAQYDEMYDNVAKVMTNPAFRAVFGENATAALLPPDLLTFAKEPVKAIRQAAVVITEPSVPGALEMLVKLADSKSVSKETVDGLELTRINAGQDQVVYAYAEKKTILLAYAPSAIKACLAARQSGASLDQTAGFQEAAAYWQPFPAEKTYSRIYMNNATIAPMLLASDNADVKRAGEMLRGIDHGYSITYTTPQGMENRARSKYRYDQLHETVKRAIDSAGQNNQSLHLLKPNSLAYNWAASLQLDGILQALAAEGQDMEKADAATREVLGVSLNELGKAIGPQYGGVLEEIVNAGLFPIPKMVFFLSVRDRKVVDTALNSLRKTITESGITGEEQETVGSNTIYSWPLLPGDAAQPAVVVTDNMLYLANNKQMLKDILAAQSTANLLAEPVKGQFGKELGDSFQRANIGSFVLYPERMAKQVGDTMDWLTGILASSKNISLARFNREIMALMQSTELIAATTETGKNQGDWVMVVKTAQSKPAESQPAQGK